MYRYHPNIKIVFLLLTLFDIVLYTQILLTIYKMLLFPIITLRGFVVEIEIILI
jgi:hypothetical protein